MQKQHPDTVMLPGFLDFTAHLFLVEVLRGQGCKFLSLGLYFFIWKIWAGPVTSGVWWERAMQLLRLDLKSAVASPNVSWNTDLGAQAPCCKGRQGAMWRGPHGGEQRAMCQLNSQTSATTTCSQRAWGHFWPNLSVLPPSTSHEAEEPPNQISELWDIVSCCFMQLCFAVINYQISNAHFYSHLKI